MKLTDATAVRVGGTAATKVYLGATQVWPAVTSGGSTAATLTIPSGKVASTLTNFVTRVDLAHMPTAWWSAVAADGGNVRVKASGADLPVDLVRFDATAHAGLLFFRAPTLAAASDNVFTVEAITDAIAPAATSPTGRNAVWADYDDVYVFTSLVSRTGSGRNLALAGDATLTTDGWLNCGARTGNAENIAGGHPIRTAWTWGASGVVTATGNNRTFLSQADFNVSASRATLSSRAGSNFGLWNSTDSWLNDPGAAAVAGSRYRFNATHNGVSDRKIWRNGALAATDTIVAQRPTSTADDLFVGAEAAGRTERWAGTLNYVYTRNGELSAAWIAAEFTSWETPASFYTVS